MIKYAFYLTVLFTFSAGAEVVPILTTQLHPRAPETVIDVAFKVDERLKRVVIKVGASEVHKFRSVDCSGGTIPSCNSIETRSYTSIFNETVALPELTLEDGKVIFTSSKGPVVCGYMGYTRILRRRKLFETQYCQLRGRLTNGLELRAELMVSN